MKKLLITGTNGFIFSNFVRKITYDKLPYKICSIDKITKGHPNNIYQNKNHNFYIGNCADEHFIDVVFEHEKPDIVIHGAASSHVDDSIKNPNQFITDNVLATQVMVNAAVKHKVQKFIQVSTDECTGSLKQEDKALTEEAILNPRNPYSSSKASAELIVQAAHNTYGLAYNITRSSNNYGPRQTADKLIPKVIKCINNNEKIPVYGQGLQMREWTYVEDNCDAIIKVIEQGENNQIYNISSSQELHNIEIIQKICNIMGKGHDLIHHIIPDPRPGHDFRYAISSEKIRKLGWSPKFSLTDGLENTVQWYLNNKWMLQ